MGMTMTQKILAKSAGLASVSEGQLIESKVDLVLGNTLPDMVITILLCLAVHGVRLHFRAKNP